MTPEQWRMLEAAEHLEEDLSGWERDFVADLMSKPDEYELSQQQDKKLKEIDEKLSKEWNG
jgi:hypothetical protein